MRMVSPEVIAFGENFLQDCPVKFSYDLVFVPSATLELVENSSAKDTSWIGIVLYEDDVNRFSEPERVMIGEAIKNCRDAFMNAGFKCEYYPMSGKRDDYLAAEAQ